jgi:hypothetical protein
MRTLPTTSLLLLGAVSAACSGSGSSDGRTAALQIIATADAPTADPFAVPLDVGELGVASALFRVGNLEIEMRRSSHSGPGSNSGPGGGSSQECEGEQGENEQEEENEHEGAEEDDEIRLPGPFVFDLVAPQTVIEEVPVVPGTFDRVELRFRPTSEQPFLGASIFLRGVFVNGAQSTPFTLRSDFDGKMDVPIANGGITVTENSVVPIELKFDLIALLEDLDFANADVVNGEITIDSTHNVVLLFFFEAGLGGCVCVCERDD